nr:IgG-binding virulence factor TspB family protein [Neisseria gonorrhoeae]
MAVMALTVLMRLEKDYERFPEVKQLMESQMERIARPFWDKRKEEIPKDTALKLHLSTFSHCEFFLERRRLFCT